MSTYWQQRSLLRGKTVSRVCGSDIVTDRVAVSQHTARRQGYDFAVRLHLEQKGWRCVPAVPMAACVWKSRHKRENCNVSRGRQHIHMRLSEVKLTVVATTGADRLTNLRERSYRGRCDRQRLLLCRRVPLRGHSNAACRHSDARADLRLVIWCVALGLLVNLGDARAPEQVEKRGALVCGLGDAEPDENPANEECGEQFNVGDVGEC